EFDDKFLHVDPIGTWVVAEIRPELRLWLDLGDSDVSRQCLMGAYEAIDTTFMESFLRPGMAFVDIGANIGWYSVLAAKIVGPAGVVYSFEPRPDTCSYLRRSISENKFAQVHIRQMALADKPGTLPVATYISAQSPGGTWLLTSEALQTAFQAGFQRFDVEVARLDDLPIERCDLLKIDIEGAEYLALQGARQTLARFKPIIISEINPVALPSVSEISVADYLRFIGDLGYEAYQITAAGPGERLGEAFATNPHVCNILLQPAAA
ncbi:MAG TPA: FkbM family methyltransferase, partial [Stellaceae bacterium]|nr:FkbM family methyltransferase [Stellaceae bacterium]